ncbi:Hypothetical protein SCLAV_0413 [Streptomyces clavuligerus]|uniref:Uncharacterized protein n=1 Tax=Streptomyces clavuligerus TaxID=1901 RepID=E2Q8F7_STRCL|nr:Hypothetical protein SCLAV_0413 [Streptomyces clavuligerus]
MPPVDTVGTVEGGRWQRTKSCSLGRWSLQSSDWSGVLV